MGKDYYKILGVNKSAGQDEIKKAFRAKAHQHHPDKAGGDEAKFKEVNEAYQILGNAEKRRQYDQFGSTFEQARSQGGFSGFEGFRDFSGFANGFNVNAEDLGDIFEGIGDIFGFGGRHSRTRTAQGRRGNDLQMIITIDFLEAVFGADKELSFRKKIACDRCEGRGSKPGSKIETCQVCGGSGRVSRVQRTFLGDMQIQSTCQACRGEGKKYSEFCEKCSGRGWVEENVAFKVKIPAGIDDNESIRLSGQGEAGEKGGPAGDLYLRVRVRPDSRFARARENIRQTAEISFTQAALGSKIDVETVDGPVALKIPEGTQSGTVFKLKGKGVPRLNGRGRGDHFVEVIVKTPARLSRRQKELLREFAE